MKFSWVVFCGVMATGVVASAQVVPESARNLLKAGQVAFEEGRFTRAKNKFGVASRVAPRWGFAYLSLGMAILEEGLEDARPALTQAVTLMPDNPRARFYLASALADAGDIDAAIRELRTTLQLRREYEDAWLKLADLQLEGRDRDGAMETYRALLDIVPKHVGALVALSSLYEQSGRISSAENALRTIVRAHPNNAYHYYRLAQFYERIGAKTKAGQAYARANRIDPLEKRKMRPLRKSRR